MRGPEIFEIDDRAAGLQACAQRAAHIDAMTVTVGRKAPGLHLVERQHQALDRVLGGRDLRRRHLREVLLLQHLAVGHGETRVDIELRRLALALAEVREQRLLHALGARRRFLVLARRRLRQHRRQQLVERATPAKEDAECLVEQQGVLVALYEHRMQRPVEIVPRADPGCFDRGQRIEHRAGTDRNAGRAQCAGEVNDVFREAAGLLRHHINFQSVTLRRPSEARAIASRL